MDQKALQHPVNGEVGLSLPLKNHVEASLWMMVGWNLTRQTKTVEY
jgi:hypothetical protein